MRVNRPSLSMVFLLGAFAASSCTASLPSTPAVGAGDYLRRMDMRVGGFRRSYRVHVPPRHDGETRMPLVVVLHGAFSTARGIERRSGFSRLADQEGFVAVYPNGYGFFDLFRHWNAGHCCGRARQAGIDDVGFIDAVIDEVEQRLETDPRRIYVIGESNGAMLAHLYAASRARRIAGAAAVIGAVGSRTASDQTPHRLPVPAAPLPVVIIHGCDDAIIPFEGGSTEREPDREWSAVSDAVAFWTGQQWPGTAPVIGDRHGCLAMPAAMTNLDHGGEQAAKLQSIEVLHEGRVIRSVWPAPPAGAPVVLYEIRGWDHRWPGRQSVGSLPDDDPLRGFDAARVVWDELSSHRRQTSDGEE